MMLYTETIKIILESLGRKDEIEFYLQRFKITKSPYFALIIPDYYTLHEFDVFSFTLEILHKLELKPLVLITKIYEKYEKITNYFYKKNEFYEIYEDKIPDEPLYKIPVVFSSISFIEFIIENKNILPQRIHFVRYEGPLRNQNGEFIFNIEPLEIFFKNYEESREIKWEHKNIIINTLKEEDRGVFILASILFNELKNSHISITSSFMLLKELFTVKGAGTFLRVPSKILHLKKEDINPEILNKIKEIIEGSFQRKLKSSLFEKISEIFIDTDFQSLIVLEKYEFGYYLSKYAVSLEARGKGIAMDLWNALLSYNYPLFWRAKQKNSIWRWYQKISDGMMKKDPWFIFWKNFPPENIPTIVNFISNREEDFYD